MKLKIHRSRLHKIGLGMTLLLSLGACGGGGGAGGGSGATSIPSGPQTDVSTSPLALNVANAQEVGTYVLGYGANAVGLAQMAVNWAGAIGPVANTGNIVCSGGGSVNIELSGSASNPTAAGNVLTIYPTNCFLKPLEDPFSGVITVQFKTPVSGYQVSGLIDLGTGIFDPNAQVTMKGQIAFDYNATADTQVLHTYSSATPVSLTFSLGLSVLYTDTVTSFDMSRQTSLATARTTNSISFTVDSKSMGGSISVTTPTPMSSWLDAYPDTGTITVTGGSGTGLTMSPISGDNPNFSIVLGGTQAATLSVVGVADYLFSGAGWVPADSTGSTYALQGATEQGLTVLAQPDLTALSTNPGPLRWIFSRPITATLVSNPGFVLTNANPATPWVAQNVSATVAISGAALTVTPLAQLNAGSIYQMNVTQGNVPNAVNDDVGHEAPLVQSGVLTATVANSIGANIYSDSGVILLGAQSTLDIESGGSHSGYGISSYLWSQVSGPALNFSNPTGPSTTVAPAMNTTTNGMAIIQLTITDSVGEQAVNQLVIPVVVDTSNSMVIEYSTVPIPNTVQTNLTNSGSNSLTNSNDDSAISLTIGGISVNVSNTPGVALAPGATLDISVPSTAPNPSAVTPNLQVAIPQFPPCTTGSSGTFNVNAISYSKTGAVLSMSADFQLICSPEVGTLYGHIRINSSQAL